MSSETPPTIADLVAIHEPMRRRIIDHLAAHGPSQVGTLARDLGAQVGSISHHLRMLERAGAVQRAPELAADGRASWWRLVSRSWSWSAEDFDAPADRHQARTAERLNVRHQADLLNAWLGRRDEYNASWRRSAFSTNMTARATAAELAELLEQVSATVNTWRESIDSDDSQEREPVFFFAHGFPFRP